jgi:hypothetical protein
VLEIKDPTPGSSEFLGLSTFLSDAKADGTVIHLGPSPMEVGGALHFAILTSFGT